MSFIALIVNPISGSDVRRFSSYASSEGFTEKMNTALRIASVAHGLGIKQIVLMPDLSGMSFSIAQRLEEQGVAAAIDTMKPFGKAEDTSLFAKRMNDAGCGCLITLGGDGTARAASKFCGDTPLIAVSSGTNNVYPCMAEGTAVGVAAAGAASERYPLQDICIRDKRIEIFINEEFQDIALIDAALCGTPFVGSRAIRHVEDIYSIVVSRCHPAALGFSSIGASQLVIRDSDSYGAVFHLHRGREYTVPLASGVLQKVRVSEPTILPLGEDYCCTAENSGTIALDGERELVFQSGDKIRFRITQKGPWRVNVEKTCEYMLAGGVFLSGSINSCGQ